MKIDKNIIGLDPSLVSTGMTINGKLFNYATKIYNKNGTLKKWYKISEDYINYTEIYYTDNKKETFTDSEINKLLNYDEVTNNILKDIIDNLIPELPVIIAIEGYSYSSNAGPLIDLVTFSTLLRNKLIGIADEIRIFPPSRLKKMACMLTYQMDDKKIWRNNNGLAGGSFKKPDMYKALTENSNLDNAWIKHLRDLQEDVMQGKSIPKPLEDVIDSYLLYLTMKERLFDI